jgi:hypothetical protein
VTQGNGPHMADVIRAAEGGRYDPVSEDERTPGATWGEPADIEPHEPGVMSERIIVRHCERMAVWL